MNSTLRVTAGIGAAALSALALAGCSSSGSGSTGSGSGVNGAAANVGNVMSLVADSMNKAQSAGTVTVSGTMSSPQGNAQMTGQFQFSPSLESSTKITSSAGTIAEIMIGSTVYTQSPLMSAMTGGKPWAEFDMSKMGGALGSISSMMSSAQNANPATQIQALVASGKITQVGTETVNGQSATHYSGTLTPAEMASESSKYLSASQLSTVQSAMKSAGITAENIDVWVGSDGLPVQEKMSMQTAKGTETSTLQLSGWGQPVSITAPSADQVTDVTSSISSMMSGLGGSTAGASGSSDGTGALGGQ